MLLKAVLSVDITVRDGEELYGPAEDRAKAAGGQQEPVSKDKF